LSPRRFNDIPEELIFLPQPCSRSYDPSLFGKMNISVARRAKTATEEEAEKEEKSNLKRGVCSIFGKTLVRLLVLESATRKVL